MYLPVLLRRVYYVEINFPRYLRDFAIAVLDDAMTTGVVSGSDDLLNAQQFAYVPD